jgi:hypothetical protein
MKTKVFRLIPGLLILLIFQNCQRNPLVFGPHPQDKKKIITDGGTNGDGYLGKPEPGEYVRTNLTPTCIKPPLNSNLQGVLEVSETESTVTLDNCQDFSYIFSFRDSRFDYYPYNPDYIGINGAIYEKSGMQTADSAVEAFCRHVDENNGLDVVAKINSNQETSIKIYTGERASFGWISRFTSPFQVQKSNSASQVLYEASDFKLNLDISNSQLLIYSGQLITTIDGKSVNETLQCRRMRSDSVLKDSPASEPVSNLVGLWQLNGNFLDLSGNNNMASPIDLNGSINFQTGRYQQAVILDGVDDQLRIAPSTSLDNLGQVTVAAWVWPADAGNGRTYGGIAHKSNGYSMSSGWMFGIGAQTRLLFFKAGFSGGALYANNGSQSIQVDNWNHVVMTWDGTSNPSGVKFYVNGLATGIGNFYAGSGSRPDDSNNPLLLGGEGDDPISKVHLKGKLDHVSVWNRVLTQAEVINLYNTGNP